MIQYIKQHTETVVHHLWAHLGEGWATVFTKHSTLELVNAEKKIRIRVTVTGNEKNPRCVAELFPLDDNLLAHFPLTNVSFAWNFGTMTYDARRKVVEKHIVRRLLHSDNYIRLTVENAELAYRQSQRKVKAADRVSRHLATLGLRRNDYTKNYSTGSITNNLTKRGLWASVEFQQYPEHKISCDFEVSGISLAQLNSIVGILIGMNPENVFNDIKFAPGVIQVSEKDYDYAKCVLPPIYAKCDSFSMWAMGEPEDYDGDAVTYYWFTERSDTGYFLACYGTETQAREAFTDYFNDELFPVPPNPPI